MFARDVRRDVRHCAVGCPYDVAVQWEVFMTWQEVFLGRPPGHPRHCGCSKEGNTFNKHIDQSTHSMIHGPGISYTLARVGFVNQS